MQIVLMCTTNDKAWQDWSGTVVSGFEVAGIVLGSLPLLISAIENYESNLDRATAFFKWKDELATALRKLWYQRSLFEMTLRNILKDIASGPEIEEMIADPRHELWKSPDLTQSLEHRLKSAYRPYIFTVGEMRSCMKRLAGHLNVERHTVSATIAER
ncbi:hypothetical protein FALBO_14412 [Fusarium albosuccineum]|uniref:Uncharacterized protein n=1 Tax=Fusarium albosuccineum TaxID=1237068 RepID=A0A8H4KY34_9HYPO|nr:hypothetical protein FALBO_14412 [Fusarium albosuccineum]